MNWLYHTIYNTPTIMKKKRQASLFITYCFYIIANEMPSYLLSYTNNVFLYFTKTLHNICLIMQPSTHLIHYPLITFPKNLLDQ